MVSGSLNFNWLPAEGASDPYFAPMYKKSGWTKGQIPMVWMISYESTLYDNKSDNKI